MNSHEFSYGAFLFAACLRVLLDVLLGVVLVLSRLASHVPYFSKDRAFRPPRSIVSTEHPKDATVRIRISAIQRILVVELNHDPQGFSWRLCPMQNLFSPKHAQVVVYMAFANKLHLGRIP